MVQEQLTDQELREREVQADMGLDFSALARTAPWRRRLLTLLYHPYTELLIFGLILTSIGLLIAEISVVDASHQGLLGLVFGRSQGLFLWADMLITLVFVSEYLLKLLVAPDRVAFFRRNLLDLLALLPILRVFRLGRAVRLFRLLRMLRVVRVGSVLEQRLERVSIESQRFRAENTVIGVYLFFSLAFGTVGITVFEKGVNDNLTSLADGLWWCVVTLTTVGYGDIYPVTPGGKIVATIIMFIGLSFYALLTSTISTVLIQRARSNQGQEMEIATLEHQVVLCGWNETGLTLLQDLLSRPGMPQVVVLTDDQDVIQVSHPRVFYIFADPTTARGLDMARMPTPAPSSRSSPSSSSAPRSTPSPSCTTRTTCSMPTTPAWMRSCWWASTPALCSPRPSAAPAAAPPTARCFAPAAPPMCASAPSCPRCMAAPSPPAQTPSSKQRAW